MKKLLLLLITTSLILGMTATIAHADEEVSIIDLLPSITTTTDAPLDPAATTEPSAQPVQTIPPDRVFNNNLQLIVTAAGDMTIGGDVRKRGDTIFERELKKQDGDLHFLMRNVKDIFASDDLTLVNFEGTLTTAPVYKSNNQFVFSAPPSYVEILKEGSIEAVALENNHILDHGEAGRDETIRTLEEAGIVWSDSTHVGVYTINDVSIAMLSYLHYREKVQDMLTSVPQAIRNAKAQYDIVIVSFHWGAELDYKPNRNQINLGRAAIDAGADLVLGHHSHRIIPIEKYMDRYIVYSLGNFSFAGNTKPSDMSTFLFQVRFNVKPDSVETDGFRIIPTRISSRTDYNDFAPTPFTDQRLIDNVINVLKSNGRGLEYAVEHYPTDWE